VRDVVVALIPSSLILLLREFGSSKSGAGVLSDGTEEDEEDSSAALAIALLVVKHAHDVVEAMAKILVLRWKKSRLLLPVE